MTAGRVNLVLDHCCMVASEGGLLAGLDRVDAPCRLIAPDGPERERLHAANVIWEPIDWNSPRRTTARHLLSLMEPGDRTIVGAGPRTWHAVVTAAAQGPTLCALHAPLSSMESHLGRELLSQVSAVFQALHTADRLRIVVTDPRWQAAYEREWALGTATIAVTPDAPSLTKALGALGDAPAHPDVAAAAEVTTTLLDAIHASNALAEELWQVRERLAGKLDALGNQVDRD